MSIECLTDESDSARSSSCDPDPCTPDLCGPDFGEDCMPDCDPREEGCA